MDNLQNKLSRLKPEEYGKSSATEIEDWKERVPRLLAQVEFKNHPIILEIASKSKDEIERIKGILSNKEDIDEKERMRLFAEKKAHEFYYKLFTQDPSSELAFIEKAVDEELEGNE